MLGLLSNQGKTADVLPERGLDLGLNLPGIAITPQNVSFKLGPRAAAPRPTQKPHAGATAAAGTFPLPPVLKLRSFCLQVSALKS